MGNINMLHWKYYIGFWQPTQSANKNSEIEFINIKTQKKKCYQYLKLYLYKTHGT